MPKCNQFDLVGKIKGRLTVLSFHHVADEKSYWLCQCQCGNQKVIQRNSIVGNNGGAKSCGCLSLEKKIAGKHGYSKPGNKKTPEYACWVSIKSRCYTDTGNNPSYKNYGGRGIRVCDRWLKSFPNFLADMGCRPTSDHSIDRIDVNGDYSPDNCRWATRLEQQNNRRNNLVLTHNGVSLTASEWARKIDVSPLLIMDRIRRGWPVHNALFEPLHTKFFATKA